jgi:hypothetical protein
VIYHLQGSPKKLLARESKQILFKKPLKSYKIRIQKITNLFQVLVASFPKSSFSQPP